MPTGSAQGATTIYTADSHWPEQVRRTRQRLVSVCAQCVNRRVRVETIDGQIYEGVVAGHDSNYLHLATGQNRFFGPYAAGFILPLLLFDLLAITLFF